MKRTWILRLICFGLTLALFVPALARMKTITAQRLREHVSYLASDDMEGRETGEKGVRKAEAYIAREFKRIGLSPLPGKSGYFIDFTLYRAGYDADETSLAVDAEDTKLAGVSGLDFRPFDFSDEGSHEAPIVFAGYGITAPEHEWDDYEGLDVEGKFVLVLRHEPDETDPDSSFDGSSSTDHAFFRTKATNAQEHGALGMLLVTDPLNHDEADDMRVGGSLRLTAPQAEDDDGAESPFLAVHISQELAGAIASFAGHPLEDVQRALDSGTSPTGYSLGDTTVRLTVKRSEDPQEVPARNVAAFIEGSDPKLKDEWVVVGGHHDHVGAYSGKGDTVYNGADDNASGTSGVLELAAAFAAREEKPRRSMAFVTFSGEEKGLLGSEAMVTQSLVPVDKIVFMLNLDMIGRNPDRDIQVFGDGFVRGMREIVEGVNENDLPFEFAGDGYSGNSDHDPFYKADIPFLFFFTGVHDDYHQLGDHIDKLNFGRMQKIVRTAYRVLDRIVEADERPAFIHHVNWLGVQVEVLDEDDVAEAVITAVDDKSRAMEAGLRKGDVLTDFDDEALDDAGKVGRHFRDIEPGSSVTLAVRRDGERHDVAVERAKVGYMGVFPGQLDEDTRKANVLKDDEGVLLRQVVADGPSGKAGLLAGDILTRISGEPVGPSSLGRRMAQIGAGETVELTIIRNDECLTIPLTLGERPERR